MYCGNCGSNNQDIDKYCTHCGQVLQRLDTGTIMPDNPFGVEYNDDKESDSVFATPYSHSLPIAIVTRPTRPTRARGFVFWTSLVMGVASFFIFFGWAISSFYLFSGIVVDADLVSKDIPNTFGIYQSLHIIGVLLSLVVCVSCNIISVLSKQNPQAQSTLNPKASYILVLYYGVIVCLVALITIASLVYAYEYTITQQLLSQGWTVKQITDTLGMRVVDIGDMVDGVESLDVGAVALMVNIVLIVIQYVWQLVFGTIGLIKLSKVSKSKN
jgi:hypothetical protein